MSFGCNNMYCLCSGECPLALHWCFMAIRSDPLSLDMFLCFYLWCHAAISLAERGTSRSMLSSFLQWERIPIMFHRLQRRPGVQFYQLRRNTSSPNLQLTSQDRFHFSYQRSEGDLRGERRLGVLVLIPDRANIGNLSRFNHGILWMIQPGVQICVFAQFITYGLNL